MSSSLSKVDLAIIVASLALVFLVGVLGGRRRPDTVRGYFLAENKMPWCGSLSTGDSGEQGG